MQKDAYLLAKISADTAENAQHVAEILTCRGGRPVDCAGRAGMEKRSPITGGLSSPDEGSFLPLSCTQQRPVLHDFNKDDRKRD